MTASRICHRGTSPTLVVRKDYIELLDGDITAACLLSFFEYWDGINLAILSVGSDRLVMDDCKFTKTFTLKEIEKGLLGLATAHKIKKGIDLLVKLGYVYRHKSSKTPTSYIYYLIANKINNDLSSYYAN